MDVNSKEVLIWIVDILESKKIPYQIVGGLAARLHGVDRPLADIDFDIPVEFAQSLADFLSPYVSKPLKTYQEELWDIEYFQIIYKGQKIEFGCEPGAKIFDRKNNIWIDLNTDFKNSVEVLFEAKKLMVMPVNELITYKSILAREVDQIDVSELKKIYKIEYEKITQPNFQSNPTYKSKISSKLISLLGLLANKPFRTGT